MRIISICPSNTELLAFLDAEHLLVGVDDYSDWPKEITTLPRLGPDLSIRMDELEALQPDLVLASLSVPGMERNIDELVRRKIPHLILDPQSLEEIGQDLLKVAHACGLDATTVHNEYLAVIEDIKTRGQLAATRPSLYWEWWPKPVFTPGNINWLTEISAITGARNLFDDTDSANIQTDWADVLERQPDYILLAWVGILTAKVKPELVKKRPGWDDMTAINHIHVMEEELYCRPSPRLIEGAIRLGKLIHPNEFNDMELPRFIKEKQI
ncbi:MULTISPECIES: cobalamin-binding protein [Planococcus]|uniref:Cobalamin-binding protein n=2 Tax=Planococcus TaxID=1372 RepID=A0ABM5WXL5_9BACL|nr:MULTISPECIES: cobalamin-binding protein [Planococcus]ALS79103.1 cobalamin-binding protein [Planococcus kocurii]AQU78939.1 cobalamin-binding protein [Planococcus faecalis]MDJ0330877.1 cobalamin-binding protein [Planococcus sp. S3-L1]OHX54691.1 cobalamin-binding protein [Planococcus faecalis]